MECIELDSGRLTPAAVDRAAKLLEDPEQWRGLAERNYQIGRRHFSFAVIRERFLPLLTSVAPCYGERVTPASASSP